MADNVRTTTITAVTSIVTALITAGVTLWVAERNLASEAPDLQDEPPAIVETGGSFRTMSASVTYDDRARNDVEGPVRARLCVLTTVATYGDGSKGCTLSKGQDGWTLTASARKATANCQASCFDF